MPLLRLPVLATALLAACATPTLPPGFAALLADAPAEQPVQFLFAGDHLIQITVAMGPGALDATQRAAVDAAAPGGQTTLTARQWGPRGDGMRVDRRYGEGINESFRSVLVGNDGAVLERSHSLAITEVPPPVLAAALVGGRRDITRVDIVSGPSVEELFRITARDGGGRVFCIECALDGAPIAIWRVLRAEMKAR